MNTTEAYPFCQETDCGARPHRLVVQSHDFSGQTSRNHKSPSFATMERWMSIGIAKATDGCKVEPDGTCYHGKQSWLLELGLI